MRQLGNIWHIITPRYSLSQMNHDFSNTGSRPQRYSEISRGLWLTQWEEAMPSRQWACALAVGWISAEIVGNERRFRRTVQKVCNSLLGESRVESLIKPIWPLSMHLAATVVWRANCSQLEDTKRRHRRKWEVSLCKSFGQSTRYQQQFLFMSLELIGLVVVVLNQRWAFLWLN